jgi:hypothetical protein
MSDKEFEYYQSQMKPGGRRRQKFHFKNIIPQFRINNRPAGMIKETATPNFDALYGAERSFS